jgi:biopolymer transport protein ExbD
VSRKAPLSSLKQISEINLTPLMDLTFILLITFIITFPLIEQGIPINLPQGRAKELSPDKATTVSVDEAGQIYVDDFPVSREEMEAQMRVFHETNPDALVMVRGDVSIQYGEVVAVMKVLNRVGISRLALVTRAEGEAQR